MLRRLPVSHLPAPTSHLRISSHTALSYPVQQVHSLPTLFTEPTQGKAALQRQGEQPEMGFPALHITLSV